MWPWPLPARRFVNGERRAFLNPVCFTRSLVRRCGAVPPFVSARRLRLVDLLFRLRCIYPLPERATMPPGSYS